MKVPVVFLGLSSAFAVVPAGGSLCSGVSVKDPRYGLSSYRLLWREVSDVASSNVELSTSGPYARFIRMVNGARKGLLQLRKGELIFTIYLIPYGRRVFVIYPLPSKNPALRSAWRVESLRVITNDDPSPQEVETTPTM